MLFSQKNISLSKNSFVLGFSNANLQVKRKIIGREDLPSFPPNRTDGNQAYLSLNFFCLNGHVFSGVDGNVLGSVDSYIFGGVLSYILSSGNFLTKGNSQRERHQEREEHNSTCNLAHSLHSNFVMGLHEHGPAFKLFSRMDLYILEFMHTIWLSLSQVMFSGSSCSPL